MKAPISTFGSHLACSPQGAQSLVTAGYVPKVRGSRPSRGDEDASFCKGEMFEMMPRCSRRSSAFALHVRSYVDERSCSRIFRTRFVLRVFVVLPGYGGRSSMLRTQESSRLYA